MNDRTINLFKDLLLSLQLSLVRENNLLVHVYEFIVLIKNNRKY